MRAPQSLVQAALNRLAARIGSGLADTAAELAVLAQDAPGRLQQEFSLFWEEVEQEAQRLEREEPTAGGSSANPSSGSSPRPFSSWTGGSAAPAADRQARPWPPSSDPQDQIDALRARVAQLARQLEQPPQGQG
jgi:hypothetical protein